MRVFLDTSTLLKKYFAEEGSVRLDEVLEESAEIAVAPTAWIEMNTVISRKFLENKISASDTESLRSEVSHNFNFFYRVSWDENFEEKATNLTYHTRLKTLDIVQLTAGILSKADFFLTSDGRLFKEAKKVLPRVLFV